MGRSLRLVAFLFAMFGAAIVTASGVDAANTYPNLSATPGGGQAGATFSATYTVRAGTGCATNAIVVIHWNAPNGARLGALASSGSCSTTFNTLRPPGGVMPGKYTLWALRTGATGNELNGTSTRASASYTVNTPPSPPPPSPPPPKPTPTPTPAPTRAPSPMPKPMSTTTARHPTPPPVVVAIKPYPSALPMAAATTDAPPPPVPMQAVPASASAPACKAAACSALRRTASSPAIVAVVESLVGRSPMPVLGTLLVAVAGVLYMLLRWAERPRPVARSGAAATHPPDPLALDPVVPDPTRREIYRPPAPEPLPRKETVTPPSPARSRGAGKREPAAAAAATPHRAQAIEDILPLALFPPTAGDPKGTNPQLTTEDGLPPMAPPPPRR